MTKQEIIKQAYGEYYEEMKPFINNNGWFDKNSFWNNTFSFGVYENIDLLFTHKEDFMIPTSILNIENNNGWIKIESEKDLPKETGHYWVKRGREISVNYIIVPESFHSCFLANLTHYKPIEKPKPPIY